MEMKNFLMVLLVLGLILLGTYCQSADNRSQAKSVVSIVENYEEGIEIQEDEEEPEDETDDEEESEDE
jgi:hypothetical protein